MSEGPGQKDDKPGRREGKMGRNSGPRGYKGYSVGRPELRGNPMIQDRPVSGWSPSV